MIVPGSANALLLRSTRYTINQSLRFRASNSAYLTRTNVSSPTNDKIFTITFCVKRGSLDTGSNQSIIGGSSTGASDNIGFGDYVSGGVGNQIGLRDTSIGNFIVQSSALYRDPTAWAQYVISVDTTQATPANRVRIYKDGTEVTYTGTTYPAQNYVFDWNAASRVNAIGRRNDTNASRYFDGYLAEVRLIDGQALTPSSFGQTDATTGAWVPRRYTGTYGANGFYLPFNDATSTTTISQDRSGNGNNWTSSGISVTSGRTFDQMTDTPTNNFATLNILDVRDIGTRSIVAAALELDTTATGSGGGRATMALPTSGKWYWEVTFASTGPSGNKGVGLGTANGNLSGAVVPTECITYNANGNTTNGGSYVASGLATYNNTNTIGIAYDAGANTVQFYKDNSAQGSAISTSGMTAPLFPLSVNPSGIATIDIYNFGQRPFTYTPPTGFVALNTANLPTPSIPNGDAHFKVFTDTGANIGSATLGAFTNKYVFIKDRQNANNWQEMDSVRGANGSNVLQFNTTNANGSYSTPSGNSVGYAMNVLSTAASNTSGTITSSVCANPSAGISVVGWTGNAVAGATVGHGLSAVPHMFWVKNYSTANDWSVYHRNQNATPQNGNLVLNSTAAYGASSEWNSTAPTSSVFSVGSSASVNGNTNSLIALVMTSIPGFSLFGSYTGNGSADGPFVWCGFRPRFVMIKSADAGGSWMMFDAARGPINPNEIALRAEQSLAELTGVPLDFTANGFKLRTTDSAVNSGVTYVFAAFAEAPFKFANAR